MGGPWALRIEDRAALTIVVILYGHAALTHDSLDQPLDLEAGDLVLVQGPDPYLLGDRAETAPRFRILPGNRPVTMTGFEVGETMNLGVRTWGSPDEAEDTTRMLTGIYADAGEASRRLLDAIEPVTLRRKAASESSYVGLLATETLSEEPGQSAVLDRLLDLVLIDTVRHRFAEHPDTAPGWYTALDDEAIGSALRGIHSDPAAPWSVVGLASGANMSRAAFSRRFSAAVGEAPMSYVKTMAFVARGRPPRRPRPPREPGSAPRRLRQRVHLQRSVQGTVWHEPYRLP